MTSIEQINKEAVRLQEEVWQDMNQHEANYTKIIEMLDAALKIEPHNISTLTNLGAALCDTGKHGKAKKFLREAISLGSKDRNTFLNLGIACINSGEEYKTHFSMADKFDEGEPTWEAYFDPYGH
jgi:tetratricopeptide (TPR) repeat protein